MATSTNSPDAFTKIDYTAFDEFGRAAKKVSEDMRRLFEASYESKVERMVEEATRAGVSDEIVAEIVSEVTRESVRSDLEEDETIQRMAERFQAARDMVRHGVTYRDDGDVAEMDVLIFTERVDPHPQAGESWADVIRSFARGYSDHRALCERLDVAKRGGRIVVRVEAVRGSRATVSLPAHLDEVAVSLLTGLPVRFCVEEAPSVGRKAASKMFGLRDNKW